MIPDIETLLLYVDHSRTSCSDDNPVNGDPHREGHSTDGITYWSVRCSRCALLKAIREPFRINDIDTHVDVSVRWIEPCQHEWIDVRNEIIESGELCTKCHAIRAGNQATRESNVEDPNTTP